MGNGKKTLIDLSKGSKTNYQEMYDSSLRQKTRKTPQVIELRKALNRQREPEFINYSNRARVVNVRPEVSHVHIPAYGGVQFIPETRDVGTDMIQSNYGIISFNDWQRQAIQQQQHQIQPRQQKM